MGGCCVVTRTRARGSAERPPGWQRRATLSAAGRTWSPTPFLSSGLGRARGRRAGGGGPAPGRGHSEMRQPRPARAGPLPPPVCGQLLHPRPRPRAFREALPGVPGWAVGPGYCCPAPRLPRHAHGGCGVSRHGAGGTRSAGAGPALTGECASGSPRTHLGVGFVRMYSHLRRSLVLGAEATPMSPPRGRARESGGTGETVRAARWGLPGGFVGPTGAGPRGPGAPPSLRRLGLVRTGPPGFGADPEEPLPCPDSQEWALAAAWRGDAVLSRE